MPQMSPLMWVVLMIFFICFYLSLGVGLYYKFYLGGCFSSTRASVKFSVFF